MNIDITTEGFVRDVTQSLINSITSEIRQRVVQDVTTHVMNFDLKGEIKAQIDSAVSRAIQDYVAVDGNGQLNPYQNNPVTGAVFTEFKNYTTLYLESLVNKVNNDIIGDLNSKLNSLDINSLIKEQTKVTVERILKNSEFNFPDNSIPGRALNPDGISIRPENILPGRISKFESTGIQDYATEAQLTITNYSSIFENRVIAKDLEIHQNLNIKGQVNPEFVNGVVATVVDKINSSYTDGTYDIYCDRVISKLNTMGIAAENIRVHGQPIITQGNELHLKIVNSNLQKIGVLRELQVVGETLLDDTVYVSKKRLGINTLSPERVLDIWDQEVQIVASKRLKDVGFFGTLRSQKLILSSNNKDNIVLNPDGSIAVSQINIGKISHSSATARPSDNKPIGHIVWNEAPNIGSAIGWISLGGARWAKFGIILDN